MSLWAEIIDMNSAALKLQEHGVLRFRGTTQTDDVSVTILKEDRIESINVLVFKVLL